MQAILTYPCLFGRFCVEGSLGLSFAWMAIENIMKLQNSAFRVVTGRTKKVIC